MKEGAYTTWVTATPRKRVRLAREAEKRRALGSPARVTESAVAAAAQIGEHLEAAYDAAYSTDPKRRWAAKMAFLEASILRGMHAGASEAETYELLDLLQLMAEMQHGDHSSPEIPSKKSVGKSDRAIRIYAALSAAMSIRKRTTTNSEAASEIVKRVDQALAGDYWLAQWLEAPKGASSTPATRLCKWENDNSYPGVERPEFSKYRQQLIAIVERETVAKGKEQAFEALITYTANVLRRNAK